MLENLIDEIYEAAAVPESWAGVSRQIATIADAVGALVISAQGSRTSWVSSSPEFDALVQRYYAFEGVEERTFRLVKAGHAGFLRDYDVFTPDEMASKPMFQLLRDMGAGSGIATAISSPSGDAFVIHAERNFMKGPASAHIVATLDYLRPHLARAALLSSRLQMEKARSAMAALQQLSLPACLIGWNGRVLEANPLFQSLIPGTVLDRRERLCLANPQADQLLRVAIQEKGTSIVRSIPVPARDNEPPYILHLIPARRAAQDVFAAASATVVLTPVKPREVPGADVLQALFDLSPAEARVSRALAQGQTLAEISAGSGVKVGTVRSQLKSVMAKTGLHRQADVVRLLQGTSLGMLDQMP